MELPSGVEWEIPRIYSDVLFSQGVVLRLLWLLSLVLSGMNGRQQGPFQGEL